MKSLFDTKGNEEIISRIENLQPDSKAMWGKMNAAQMLVHVQNGLRSALGELKLKRGLAGILFGRIAKRSMVSDKPFKPNLPTDKHFKAMGDYDFHKEKEELARLVKRFGQETEGVTNDPHPFFGNLTTKEWDLLMWKHLDHHLRQFGV